MGCPEYIDFSLMLKLGGGDIPNKLIDMQIMKKLVFFVGINLMHSSLSDRKQMEIFIRISRLNNTMKSAKAIF